MGSFEFAQQIFGLISIGALGLFIHVSADLGNVGCITQWTLEITTDRPVKIYPEQFIGQIVFWKLLGERKQYQGIFHQMPQSLPSKHWKEQ
jgi:dCTP deaminase